MADPGNVVLQRLRGIREVLDNQVANMSVRIDRIDARLDRVEKRLGLIEA
jgi:hypothetical protein